MLWVVIFFWHYFQSALPGYHLSLNRFTQYKNTLISRWYYILVRTQQTSLTVPLILYTFPLFLDHVTAVPSAMSGHAGPGVGVRLNYGWQPPKSTPIRFTKPIIPDRETAKLDKFNSVLAGPNTDLGMYLGHCLYQVWPWLSILFPGTPY